MVETNNTTAVAGALKNISKNIDGKLAELMSAELMSADELAHVYLDIPLLEENSVVVITRDRVFVLQLLSYSTSFSSAIASLPYSATPSRMTVEGRINAIFTKQSDGSYVEEK
jgi:hypothetical protein